MESNDYEHEDWYIIQERVKSLLDCVRNEESHTNRFSPSFYKVHSLRRNSFTPWVVSIGPLYRQDENVLAFERQKASYLIKLMSHIPAPQEEILESCVILVYTSMKQIRECYGNCEQIMRIDDDELANMIVMDACFILAFVNEISVYDNSYRGNMLLDQTVIYDLVLLENQISFFILDEIFQCTILKFKPDTTLVDFMCPLLNLFNFFKADIRGGNTSISTTHHILSLLHECYKPQGDIKSNFLSSTIHSAVDLDRTGVNFKPNLDLTWIMGMKVNFRFPCFFGYWGKPTLTMPVLHIHDFTELVLSNLIAYEQQSSQTNKYITSYAYAMDMLVNTQEDIAKLVDSRVVVNNMGSNEEAANMINNICKQVARVHFFYGEEWEKLNMYCNGYWPKNIAWLRRTYFNSPWNIIALFAGIILFALTVVQTFFTVKSAGNK